MYSFTRGVSLPVNCFKSSKKLISLFDTNRNSFHLSQNLRFCSHVIRAESRKNVFKSPASSETRDELRFNTKIKTPEYSVQFYKFYNTVRKAQANAAQNCANIINKLCGFLQNESDFLRMHQDCKKFLASSCFQSYCTALNNALPQVRPEYLVTILKMEYLGVPVSSPLMRKTLTLILDNINNYSALEKILIFLTISRPYFEGSKECNDLKKTFKVYFESAFEKELTFCTSNFLMVKFIEDDNLPIKTKTVFLNKILDDIFSEAVDKKYLSSFFESLFTQSPPLLSNSRILEILHKGKRLIPVEHSLNFIQMYKNVVENDNSLYDEKLCDDILTELFASKGPFTDKKFAAVHLFSLMGYLDDNSLKNIAEKALIIKFKKRGEFFKRTMTSLLVQTCLHERDVIEPENWMALKNEMESHGIEVTEITNFSLKVCQYLTFLGCDTKNLVDSIFKLANYSTDEIDGEDCEVLLHLHHLAKAFLTGGYTPLQDKTLKRLLEKAAAANASFSAGLTDFVGGEEYLLKNCMTPDNHFLHYVAVLGPDNKAVNLSSSKQKTYPSLSGKLQDIDRLSGSKVVAFQRFTESAIKFFNSPITPGLVRLYLKPFESLNIDVVLLPKNFETLSPEKRTEYLRTRLNEISEKR